MESHRLHRLLVLNFASDRNIKGKTGCDSAVRASGPGTGGAGGPAIIDTQYGVFNDAVSRHLSTAKEVVVNRESPHHQLHPRRAAAGWSRSCCHTGARVVLASSAHSFWSHPSSLISRTQSRHRVPSSFLIFVTGLHLMGPHTIHPPGLLRRQAAQDQRLLRFSFNVRKNCGKHAHRQRRQTQKCPCNSAAPIRSNVCSQISVCTGRDLAFERTRMENWRSRIQKERSAGKGEVSAPPAPAPPPPPTSTRVHLLVD